MRQYVPFVGSNFVTEPLKSGPSQGPLTLLLSKPIEWDWVQFGSKGKLYSLNRVWRGVSLGSRVGVPNLWDLMPDDLRWIWYNTNRNKVHNKCNALESSWNHPLAPSPWKNCLLWNGSLVQKGLQIATLKHAHPGGGRGCFLRSSRGEGRALEGSAAEWLTLLRPPPGQALHTACRRRLESHVVPRAAAFAHGPPGWGVSLSQEEFWSEAPRSGLVKLDWAQRKRKRLDFIWLLRFYFYFLNMVNGLCWWQYKLSRAFICLLEHRWTFGKQYG